MWSWPLIILNFFVNLYTILDGLYFNFLEDQTEIWSHYPDFYDNFLAYALIRKDGEFMLGPWKFYDMFSLNGFNEFVLDGIIFNFFPVYYWFTFIMRNL